MWSGARLPRSIPTRNRAATTGEHHAHDMPILYSVKHAQRTLPQAASDARATRRHAHVAHDGCQIDPDRQIGHVEGRDGLAQLLREARRPRPKRRRPLSQHRPPPRNFDHLTMFRFDDFRISPVRPRWTHVAAAPSTLSSANVRRRGHAIPIARAPSPVRCRNNDPSLRQHGGWRCRRKGASPFLWRGVDHTPRSEISGAA
jgi:hypothetical protein